MRRILAAAAACTAVALLAPTIATAQPRSEDRGNTGHASESARLSAGLAAAVSAAGFDSLVDYDNIVAGVAQPAQHLPNVDTAVIELDRRGNIVGVAQVLYDRDSPTGYRVRVDRRSLEARGVQFSRWRLARWDDQAQWAAGPAAQDVLVAPKRIDKQYMISYPASVLKLMVGYSVLRLVDKKVLRFGTKIVYHEVAGKTCGYGPSNPSGATPAPVADGATDTVAGWFDQMITVSDNFATCVLLQALYDNNALDAANEHFQRIGLTTLRMQPSQPEVGTGWSSGTMSMGALDTARLLLLVSGARGAHWRTSRGNRVDGRVLSDRSKTYFRKVLAEQSFNEVLNPVNLCGSTDAVQGIPSTVPDRWIDPTTGHVTTYDGDLPIDFGFDVRPCVAAAQVSFAHKTGLTYNAGGDAGIVRALPGQDGRWYVVATLSSVGNRFGDPDWATSDPNACEGSPYVCYPRAFGRLGGAIDTLVKERPRHLRR